MILILFVRKMIILIKFTIELTHDYKKDSIRSHVKALKAGDTKQQKAKPVGISYAQLIRKRKKSIKENHRLGKSICI